MADTLRDSEITNDNNHLMTMESKLHRSIGYRFTNAYINQNTITIQKLRFIFVLCSPFYIINLRAHNINKCKVEQKENKEKKS